MLCPTKLASRWVPEKENATGVSPHSPVGIAMFVSCVFVAPGFISHSWNRGDAASLLAVARA